PRVSIFSSLSLQHPSRVYQIPTDARTHSLGIELISGIAGVAPLEGIALFDEAGRKLAESISGPDRGVLSMDVSLDRMNPLTGMYLKVAAPSDSFGPTANPTLTSDDFVLQVTRDPSAVPTAPDTFTPALPGGPTAAVGSASTSTLLMQGTAQDAPAG